MADRILARKTGRVDDVPLNELIARIAAANGPRDRLNGGRA